MKLVLDNEEEQALIRKGSVSIDELVALINQHDLDRMLAKHLYNIGTYRVLSKDV